MAAARPDFVQVQLSAAGTALAGGHPLRYQGGRRAFEFTPGASIEVEKRYEWNAVLRIATDGRGNLLFELAPPAAPTPASEPAQS